MEEITDIVNFDEPFKINSDSTAPYTQIQSTSVSVIAIQFQKIKNQFQ